MRRILVVDDAPSNRKMLIRLLTRKGFVCVEAEDGQQALNAYSQLVDSGQQLTAIITDYEMPVMNGPQATKKFREMCCKIPIVGVTGNMLEADVQYFKEQGADEVMGKPLDLVVLERILNRYAI